MIFSFRVSIPPCGNRESGVLETAVPEIWNPPFRRFGNRRSGKLETALQRW